MKALVMLRCAGVDQFLLLPHPLVQEVGHRREVTSKTNISSCRLQSVGFTAPNTSLDTLAWLLKRIASFRTGNIFIPAKPTGQI